MIIQHFLEGNDLRQLACCNQW